MAAGFTWGRSPSLDRWTNTLPLGKTALILAAAAAALVLCAEPWGQGDRLLPLTQLLSAPALVLAVGRLRARRCPEQAFALVALGLLVGLGVRLLLYGAHPLPLVAPDTGSYVDGAHALLAHGDLDLSPTRTPGYPLLHAGAVALGGLTGARALQVALSLAAAAGLALGLRNSGAPPAIVAAATCFALVDPRAVAGELYLLTEPAFALTMVALGVSLLRAADGPWRARRWFLVGALGGTAVLVRPVGLAPLAVALATPLLLAGVRPPRRVTGSLAVALGAAGPLVAWSLRNLALHGFFGLTLFGGTTLMGVAGHLVVLDSPANAAAKAEIAPAVSAYRARGDLNAINWLMHHPDGATSRLRHLPPLERDRVQRALAWEGIRASPLRFLASVWVRGRPFLRPRYAPARLPALDPPLVKAQAARWRDLAFPRLVAELRLEAPAPASTQRLLLWERGRLALRLVNALAYPLLGALHLLGLLAAVVSRDRRVVLPVALAWSVLGLTMAANVALPRYLTPLHPLLLLGLGALWADPRNAP
jgi:hypothetical protein